MSAIDKFFNKVESLPKEATEDEQKHEIGLRRARGFGSSADAENKVVKSRVRSRLVTFCKEVASYIDSDPRTLEKLIYVAETNDQFNTPGAILNDADDVTKLSPVTIKAIDKVIPLLPPPHNTQTLTRILEVLELEELRGQRFIKEQNPQVQVPAAAGAAAAPPVIPAPVAVQVLAAPPAAVAPGAAPVAPPGPFVVAAVAANAAGLAQFIVDASIGLTVTSPWPPNYGAHVPTDGDVARARAAKEFRMQIAKEVALRVKISFGINSTDYRHKKNRTQFRHWLYLEHAMRTIGKSQLDM